MQELIEEATRTELKYRHFLSFDQKSIFGIEMEGIDYNKFKIK